MPRSDADAPEPTQVKQALSPRGAAVVLVALGTALSVLTAAHAQPAASAKPASAKGAPGSAAPSTPPASAPVTSPASAAPPPSAAPATSPKATKPGKPAKPDPAKIAADLAKPETYAAGFAAAWSAGPAAKKVAPRIEAILSKGLPVDLAMEAIGALGAIGLATSSAAIAPYVKYRHAAVRHAAASALGQTGGPAASAALIGALRSNDDALRRIAATRLGEIGSKESVPDLLRALDRDVTEAGLSIATLCGGAQCGELLELWDKLPAPAQSAAIAAMLKRKAALPRDVVARLTEKKKAAEGKP